MPTISMSFSGSTTITVMWSQSLIVNVTRFRINATLNQVIGCPRAVGSSNDSVVSLESLTMTNESLYVHEVEGLTPYSEYIVTLTALNDGGSSLEATTVRNTSSAGNCMQYKNSY